ncbi:hypothetical protein AMTR_s00030p00112790 [Amborella trichopoda]|uniref:Uncharacterized protein n=1 Tax=Amborella trichopoda TaxID=13333 RepID=U5D3S3_AMBTC|nr:hypothetical protein AMTR_s00030p00112790 [Amborella trichopoda]
MSGHRRAAVLAYEEDITSFSESQPFPEGFPTHVTHELLAEKRPQRLRGYPLILVWFQEWYHYAHDWAKLVVALFLLSMTGVFHMATSHINFNLLEALAERFNPLANTFFLPNSEAMLPRGASSYFGASTY